MPKLRPIKSALLNKLSIDENGNLYWGERRVHTYQPKNINWLALTVAVMVISVVIQIVWAIHTW